MKASPFVMLCSAGLFAIFSSTISKSPVLPLFASHLGADPSGVGFVASVSAFTGVVASIPAGLFSDKIGRKRVLLFSVFIFCTAPFLYLWVSEIWQLAIVRFYHGLATAVFIPVAMALVADLFRTERGEKIAWFSTATLVGRFLAPIAGGGIIGAITFNPGFSYRLVYIACGIAGIIAFLITLKIPVTQAKKTVPWKETCRIFRAVVSNKAILMTSIVEAAILFAYGTFETFLPLYALIHGLSAYEIGVFLSVQVLTLASTKPVMGRFSDRYGRKSQIFAGAIIGAGCIGGFSLFQTFFPLLFCSILFGLCLSIVTSATSAFIADLSRSEAHGSAMGILGSIMDIGHSTGPLLAGIVASYFGLRYAFLCASAVLLLIALFFLLAIFAGRKDETIFAKNG